MLEPLDGLAQKLGTSGQIPIRISYAYVTQVGGQHRQQLLDGLPGSIPANERAHRETVAKVVNARPGAIRWLTKTDLSRDLPEGPIDILMQQLPALLCNEEIGASRWIKMRISLLSVATQLRAGRRMQRYEARLAELGTVNPENPLLKIHIRALERQCLADPQTCDCLLYTSRCV